MEQQTETNQDTAKPDYDAIADDIKTYFDTNMELYKLQATEKAALLASDFAIIAVMLFFILLMVLFGSVALAITLAKVTGKLYLGYLTVAGIYLLLTLIIYFSRHRWLKAKLADNIIKSIYSK